MGSGAKPSIKQILEADRICVEFENQLDRELPRSIEQFLAESPEPIRGYLFEQLLLIELDHRKTRSKRDCEEYIERFPDYREIVKKAMSDEFESNDSKTEIHQTTNAVLPTASNQGSGNADEIHPESIGRYRVERLLGSGGFGHVFLAQDAKLGRRVAVKVPHKKFVRDASFVDFYLSEARTAAQIEHPNIVPVYDVGSSELYPCYIVSKYIPGADLRTRIDQGKTPFTDAAELVAKIANALHHAHRLGIVHRDIKPANVIVDETAEPYIVDFGLALRDDGVSETPAYVGTPAYMSPEQARGEGHRVDGRSDIFSLGIVLYETLTGRNPFRGVSQANTTERIIRAEPRPLRQYDERIPPELQRICQRTLCKRSSERYESAHDLARDLDRFVATQKSFKDAFPAPITDREMQKSIASAEDAASSDSSRDSQRIDVAIVPKGLRSFDEHDSDFFMELMPGPRDRHGTPDIIRFWKQRIEANGSEDAFSVGLIYGPSGCGKSSLIRAGLFPMLSDDITTIYIEATGEDTEARLLNHLCRPLPSLRGLDLPSAMASARRRLAQTGDKLLVVIDQFEQWLHANEHDRDSRLSQALRHCDGDHLQCVLTVRDDFWMSVTRFMRELEIPILEGRNSNVVDLFPVRHARRVLAAYGRAFGDIPDDDLSREQRAFLKQAIDGLSEHGKVVCVRLAIFAQMMQGKPWTVTTLKRLGGTEGVGEAFLEETFNDSAPPLYRYHHSAIRSVLTALLPEPGTQIKGVMRSHDELIAAAHYQQREDQFREIIRILNSELRLITPTDPTDVIAEHTSSTESPVDSVGSQSQSSSRDEESRHYQLSHDYLVPSMRNWLQRKQQESRAGRAKLRLAEYEAIWSASQNSQHLPSLADWLNIQLLTKDWSAGERALMYAGGRKLFRRYLVIGLCCLLFGLIGYQANGRYRAKEGLKRIVDAEITQLPNVIEETKPYRRWLHPMLREANAISPNDPRTQLHTAIALLQDDAQQASFLRQSLKGADPDTTQVICDSLERQQLLAAEDMWQMWKESAADDTRLPIASALAMADPNGDRWREISQQTAQDLTGCDTVLLGGWRDLLMPVRSHLLKPLADIFRDEKLNDAQRTASADVLLHFVSDRPESQFELLLDADHLQFAKFFAAASESELITDKLAQQLAHLPNSDGSELLFRRWGNAAIAMVRLGQEQQVWPLLMDRTDPTARSCFVHRYKDFGGDPEKIAKAITDLSVASDDFGVLRSLILMLGDFRSEDFDEDTQHLLTNKLKECLSDVSDGGVHSATEWLLRSWGLQETVENAEQIAATGFEERIALTNSGGDITEASGFRSNWYVNSSGITMVTIGPGEFTMGAPDYRHPQRINRRFSIATKEVSRAQFEQFQLDSETRFIVDTHTYAPTMDSPQVDVPWYAAAAYCNWLSAKDGIPPAEWCYVPNVEGKFAQGMRPAKNFLSRLGYRLPTEQEWEFACRAGTTTEWHFGSNADFLKLYGWFQSNALNRTSPVGMLRPSPIGLFDINGNGYEWCQNARYQQPPPREDPYDDEVKLGVILDKEYRVLRGGGYLNPAKETNSHNRYDKPPDTQQFDLTFRVVKTEP